MNAHAFRTNRTSTSVEGLVDDGRAPEDSRDPRDGGVLLRGEGRRDARLAAAHRDTRVRRSHRTAIVGCRFIIRFRFTSLAYAQHSRVDLFLRLLNEGRAAGVHERTSIAAHGNQESDRLQPVDELLLLVWQHPREHCAAPQHLLFVDVCEYYCTHTLFLFSLNDVVRVDCVY